jgi:hypothetical protein
MPFLLRLQFGGAYNPNIEFNVASNLLPICNRKEICHRYRMAKFKFRQNAVTQLSLLIAPSVCRTRRCSAAGHRTQSAYVLVRPISFSLNVGLACDIHSLLFPGDIFFQPSMTHRRKSRALARSMPMPLRIHNLSQTRPPPSQGTLIMGILPEP